MNKFTTAFWATAIMIFAIATVSNATIRRVGYWGTPTALDYTNLQNAYNASIGGDTIQVYPSSSNSANYGGISAVTHKILILGNGRSWGNFNDYGVVDTANYNVQTITGSCNVGAIYLGVGSDSSVISGLSFNSGNCDIGYCNSTVKGINGVIIQRCEFWGGCYINLDGNNDGNKIIDNYFADGAISCNYYDHSSSTTNLKVSNNIFRCASQFTYNVIYQYGSGVTGMFNNNIIRDPLFSSTNTGVIYLPTGRMVFENNISNGLTLNAPLCMFYNNIGTGTEWPISSSLGSGNLQNIPYSSLFVNSFNNSPTLSPEARFVLKANSPAVNYYYGGSAASGGGTPDCGIYGGPTPHILSGVPAAPVIYNVTAPANNQPTNGSIQLIISAKTLN